MFFYVFLCNVLAVGLGKLVLNHEEFESRWVPGHKPVNKGATPDYWDWRERDSVSPVKDQLNCNACWAFTIAAAIESHVRIHTGAKEILSEQFLIDCVDRNGGCRDASLLKSYALIVSHVGGILRNEDYYPYAAAQKTCRWKPPRRNSSTFDLLNGPNEFMVASALPVPVIGYKRIQKNEQHMAEYIYRYGPITAAINSESMAVYKGGIDEPTDAQCDPSKPNHSVLIVGYNEYVPQNPSERRVKYWIIKNSWGTDFGDKGYYYLVRGRNACGIANDVSMPFVN